METRHPKLSRDTKFEEIRAPKYLQTVAQNWTKKKEKKKKKKNGEASRKMRSDC